MEELTKRAVESLMEWTDACITSMLEKRGYECTPDMRLLLLACSLAGMLAIVLIALFARNPAITMATTPMWALGCPFATHHGQEL